MKSRFNAVTRVMPGLGLCAIVTALAFGLANLESRLFGRAWLEPLVLAILLGTGLRTLSRLHKRYESGIHLGAKLLLEIAVVLLGASVSARTLLQDGFGLVAGIAGTVVCAIGFSYLIGRSLGLPKKMAVLIACGNSICGNSAIAAVAPVIDADSNDVAASISFTAVLGVIVVLGLPLLMTLLSMTPLEYGVFAGLTVYAVPQVLAATASVSLTSVHVGTLVKLVRVLMLGPVVLVLSIFGKGSGRKRTPLTHLVPWFIVGFLVLLWLRTIDVLPHAILTPAHEAADALTIMSMAALGLGVDARSVVQAGGRVVVAVLASLAGLGAISLALIRLLGI